MNPKGTDSSDKIKPSTRKVTVGALAGALVTVGVWVIGETTTIEIPDPVSAALGTILTAIFVYNTEETYFEIKD
ncbi:hypothetical protein HRE53_33170 (plasmid) [Acaryochloris sp. 'Moss Beach']|uniref:hypothetical protein n=1 Tax=Acaryochloris sp. 'Moss Beach' TaxID=2740837 RepID=UPI001F36DBF3|nr:hypothetical protein [Acaryochloris sp. 'Moss Beach']UJB73439.1 hypothetical protein HRE53_33170 [Acaryochloris sp. 'Moss Beach']